MIEIGEGAPYTPMELEDTWQHHVRNVSNACRLRQRACTRTVECLKWGVGARVFEVVHVVLPVCKLSFIIKIPQ